MCGAGWSGSKVRRKCQTNERRILYVERRTSNYAALPASLISLSLPGGLRLRLAWIFNFKERNSQIACSLPAGVGSAEEVGDLILETGGVDLVFPALHDLSAGGDQDRVGDRAFPFGIDDVGEHIASSTFI